jgi:signal transduction histidine kinase
MQRLVNDLLEAAREEASGLELVRRECPARPLVELTEELFRDRAVEAGVQLQFECRANAAVLVDRDRILQVLANLVGNALSYSPRGSVISLSATAEPDRVRFSVTDAGPGIPTAELERIFAPYQQGSGRRRGSLGLGLHICKTIVEAHGGRIGVQSVRGEGTMFWFTVPTRRIGSDGDQLLGPSARS